MAHRKAVVEAELKALRERERFFRTVADCAGDWVYWEGPQREILYMSPSGERITAYPPADFINDPGLLARIVHPEDRPQVDAHAHDQGRRGASSVEFRIVRRDGTIRWIEHVCQPVYGANKQFKGWRVSNRDITDRKENDAVMRAHLRLQEHTASVRTAQQVLVATLDEAETLTGSRVGFFHFLESDQQTLSLQVWSTRTSNELCQAEGQGRHYDVTEAGVWVDCIHQRRPVIHNDYRALPNRMGFPPGHAIITRELVVPVMRRGQIVAILGVGNKSSEYGDADVEAVSRLADLAWDIAERKRLEVDAQRSAFLLGKTEQISKVGGWQYDVATKTLDWTEEVYRIYGVSNDYNPNALEKNFAFYAPDDQLRITNAFRRAVTDGEPYDLELQFCSADGAAKWVRTVGKPELHNGHVLRVIGNIMDVTTRKRAEERQALLAEIARRLNDSDGIASLSGDILALLKEHTGIEAIGLRVREGEDYPYFASDGFPSDFIKEDRYLCLRNPTSEIVRDTAGNPCLECIGGMVVHGQTDAALPFFTEGGSFWINHATELTASACKLDSPIGKQNRCFVDGYESAALIPLRSGDEILGLLQLNDKRPERFTRELVQFLESVATNIGIAVARNRMHDALRFQSEIANNIAEAVYIVNTADLRILYANPKMERLFGYDPGEMNGQHVSILNAPSDTEPLQTAREIEAALIENGAWHGEVRNIRKDGASFWGESTISKFQHPEYGPVYISLQSDITERKRAEQALRESEQRYRALFDRASDGIFIIDADGHIIDLNESFARMHGYSVAELRAKNLRELIPPEVEKAFSERVKRLFAGESLHFEVRHIHKEGHVLSLDVVANPIELDGKQYILGFHRDLSERKLLEEQLAQAQKMESVGRLAGGVAHDFNNMLAAILGYAEMAMEQLNPALPLYNDLREIQQAAQRSADLTRQLLTFARKQVVTPKIIDLNETVEGMFRMLRRLIGEDIDLAWMPGKNLWSVNIDPSQIDQILANLCVNARDAITGVGKVNIMTARATIDRGYCATHADVPPGDYVLIAVSDDGCGMDKEIVAHIFEPFFTTKEQGKGTGLGLATVYGIVKQNRGFITVLSEPQHGTTFKVFLPRYVASDQSADVADPDPPVARGHETVLLVEDEPAILHLSKLILEGSGYAVLAADTPGDAVRQARKHSGKIHLLVTDVVMPEMNGVDLAKQLTSFCPDLKCLFMSGYTADVVALRGVLSEGGGAHFIQKPFSKRGFATKVREALDRG